MLHRTLDESILLYLRRLLGGIWCRLTRLLGGIVCWWNGKHRRGKLTAQTMLDTMRVTTYACPRCGRLKTYRVKARSDVRHPDDGGQTRYEGKL